MIKSIAKVLSLVSFMIFLFVFQSSFASAKELSVVNIEKSNQIEELTISEDSIINAEEGVLIPKLIITNGATIVEINANVQILEVAAQNNVELIGKGNITDLIISTGSKVAVNTAGDIHKLEVTNKDARIVVKEGTKIAELVIPNGAKASDIITNYENAKGRFENIVDGAVKDPQIQEPPVIEEELPVETEAPEEGSTPPTEDETTPPPSDDNTTPPTEEETTPQTVTVTEGLLASYGKIGDKKYITIKTDDDSFIPIFYENPLVQYKHFINGNSVESNIFELQVESSRRDRDRVIVEEGIKDEYNTINLIIPLG
ncbi:hypothetical protein [Bacillus sp. S/N-304-OC-R1]|uniref:hypothetical protein n=1 Tax=Bacillus sp. S/N-304-OC-R1 TaxID=2758034 RepID=UPI001C8EA636|nr:hypothetical protein [Bacillus sp. S/N-304-OC-R1]MBY0122139.1 hypothetical protein [Bacillus sp. S/N-304-OC-R1]